ncbi:flagellar basal-body rod protein FlgG [Borrelia miyamotoi]|uniref:Flagellar basal-body rod protein FlgG n=1 Tax=Borrelia miyamotoi TaxID=47466 RepID=A0AAX3JLD5_9SPIR|nr:flagellar basal-body rod protein FlgG [Borrelia miyamotoi]QFP41607.1 flagellar basal-body rod protein FlgG [Borrelia miyamotoi]QFP47727.1 flagellar basal-body rod protein FlgG [Borrelia miyamotoi]QGT55489.1 flagellar basal-body rod protein FlgG [Borrelia miyamotoi]QGT56270.1 flagellar basal-body rod protein FlgG [Borrelia miyamotoi]WAZ71514.1 flagellar basal-body rod protein FlgG [Borrelia miyamotoi]
MMRALWTAASGMKAQQYNVDTIANNLSNVNTIGFKKIRAEFEDLIYQTQRRAGTPATENTVRPIGNQVGHGTKVSATHRIFEQGKLQATNLKTDIAIEGEGFYKVLLPDGTYGYTRDGSFKIDSNGALVTSQGYKLLPDISFPEGYVKDSIAISEEGIISVKVDENPAPIELGQIEIVRFINPSGLNAIGNNIFKETIGSGEEISGTPGSNGMGRLRQGILEMSNVSIADELVTMIVAQRAYEINSKAIQTSDNMLGIANNLKR